MQTQNESDHLQFIKDRIRTQLTGLSHTALEHEGFDDTMQRFVESWVLPTAIEQDAYKMPMFDSYGFVYYTPKDGDSRPRYGVQAILNGPLFENRKDFRSLRLARLWVKQQMTCKCWPKAVPETTPGADERTLTMTVTFDSEGPLDMTRLAKNEALR